MICKKGSFAYSACMRVALVTPEYVTERTFDGGLANYVYRLALSLKRMGHEPVIFLPHDHDETFFHRGIEVQRVQTWHLFTWNKPYSVVRAIDTVTRWRWHMWLNLLWRSFRVNLFVRRAHRLRPFDIVHYAHLGGLGLFRPKDVPCITRLSSHTGLCQQFGGYGEPDAQIRQQQRVERASLRKSDRIFGPSHKIAKLISAEIDRDIDVVESPFFLETEDTDDTIYRDHLSDKRYVLFFGTIGLIKGVGTIAEIIHSLLERHKDLSFVFIGKVQVVPEGGTMMDRVRTNAREHASRVVHFHALPHEKLYPLIQHACAVALPSRIDNFPNACIEAMFFKRVVIGTMGNGFEQLIDHKKSGYLIPVDDSAALLSTLTNVLALPDAKRVEIGAYAAKRIQRLHPDVSVRALLHLYQSTIDARQTSRPSLLRRWRSSPPVCAASAAS